MSTIGENLLEERRRRRRAGDPRIIPEGRELLLRMTTGDLMNDFQAALDADLEADPILAGHDTAAVATDLHIAIHVAEPDL